MPSTNSTGGVLSSSRGRLMQRCCCGCAACAGGTPEEFIASISGVILRPSYITPGFDSYTLNSGTINGTYTFTRNTGTESPGESPITYEQSTGPRSCVWIADLPDPIDFTYTQNPGWTTAGTYAGVIQRMLLIGLTSGAFRGFNLVIEKRITIPSMYWPPTPPSTWSFRFRVFMGTAPLPTANVPFTINNHWPYEFPSPMLPDGILARAGSATFTPV